MKSVTVLAATTLFCLVPFAAAEVKVIPASITETRIGQLIKGENENSPWQERNSLKLHLKLEGSEIKGATHFGNVDITEAVDDTGASLKPKEAEGGGILGMGPKKDGFTEIDPLRNVRPGASAGDSVGPITLELNAPKREAKKIAKLTGQFMIKAGGETKNATTKKLTALLGKKIQDPALQAAKVQITILDPKQETGMPAGEGNSLALQISGDMDAVQKIELLDEHRKQVSEGYSSLTDPGGNTTREIMMNRPLDDTLSLEVQVIVGQKTVKVPFDLRDVALP